MNAINIRNLTVGYEDKIIIEDLSLDIKKGKITTIIGENGCGKSTLLKAIGRILPIKKGEILIFDKDIHKTKTATIAKYLGLLPQNPVAPDGLTVQEIVEYGRYPHKKGRGALTKEDREIVEWSMKQTNTYQFRETDISSLSGGQRQRVWISMILAQDTDIILLDEPTTYLDMAYQLEILELVQKLNKERQKTIVMVLHDINQAGRFSDELVLLKNGKIIMQGTPDDAITNKNLKQVFNIDADILKLEKTQKPACISYELIK